MSHSGATWQQPLPQPWLLLWHLTRENVHFCCGRHAAVVEHMHGKYLPMLLFFLPSCSALSRLLFGLQHTGYPSGLSAALAKWCTWVRTLLDFQYTNVLSQNMEKPWSHSIKPIRFLSIKLKFKATLTHSLRKTPYSSVHLILEAFSASLEAF